MDTIVGDITEALRDCGESVLADYMVCCGWAWCSYYDDPDLTIEEIASAAEREQMTEMAPRYRIPRGQTHIVDNRGRRIIDVPDRAGEPATVSKWRREQLRDDLNAGRVVVERGGQK